MEKRELLPDFTQNKAERRGSKKKMKDLNDDKRVSSFDNVEKKTRQMDYWQTIINSPKRQTETDSLFKVSLTRDLAEATNAKDEERRTDSSFDKWLPLEAAMDCTERNPNPHNKQTWTDGTYKVSSKEKAEATKPKNRVIMLSSDDNKWPRETTMTFMDERDLINPHNKWPTMTFMESNLNPHNKETRTDGTRKVFPRDIAESTSGPKLGRRLVSSSDNEWPREITMTFMDERDLNPHNKETRTDGTCKVSSKEKAEATSAKNRVITVPEVVPATTSPMMRPNVSPVSLHRRQNLPSTSSASRHNTTLFTVPSESTRKHSLDILPKKDYGTCIMCISEESRLAFVPCGHVCLCETCFPRFKVKFDRCPICQEIYTTTLKIYLGGSCA